MAKDPFKDFGGWVNQNIENVARAPGDFLTSNSNPFHQMQVQADAIHAYDPDASSNKDIANAYWGVGFQKNMAKLAKYKETKTLKILGVTNVILTEQSYKSDKTNRATNALTETLDTTTYPDRAILKLYNGRGWDAYLISLSLDGNRIVQYSGENGELIHDSLKRDDDIRRNGETVFEIGNEYIVTADQCAKIADYWYKFLGKKKHLYSLSIPGCAPWYNVGDWYNLAIGEADTNEYIDAVVECYAVDVEKSAGGIGSTTLLLRDVEDNWSKTTLYTARLATGGSPKRRVNRSNIVTVASSTYDGTYDYKCDGTDDNVQIQAAIEYVSNTWGGGTVQLTSGIYIMDNNGLGEIDLKNNITLRGVGNATILFPNSVNFININNINGVLLSDFTINAYGVRVQSVIHIVDDTLNSSNIIQNIQVTGCIPNPSIPTYLIWGDGTYNNTTVKDCYFDDCIATTGTATICAIYKVAMATNNRISTMTGYGAGGGFGIAASKKCQQNSVYSASTAKYGTGAFQSYADAGTSNACDDTADGGFNS